MAPENLAQVFSKSSAPKCAFRASVAKQTTVTACGLVSADCQSEAAIEHIIDFYGFCRFLRTVGYQTHTGHFSYQLSVPTTKVCGLKYVW